MNLCVNLCVRRDSYFTISPKYRSRLMHKFQLVPGKARIFRPETVEEAHPIHARTARRDTKIGELFAKAR
jgi:hypothetical protein